MSWSESKIFKQLLADFFKRTASFAVDLDGDTFKAALYGDTITPDNDVTAANSAYNAGVWANTAEISDTGEWDAGGEALTGVTLDVATADILKFDATDAASGSAANLADVYGVLVYDDTVTTPVADQGVCYNYLGGANSVVNGTFTVVWSADGLFKITL